MSNYHIYKNDRRTLIPYDDAVVFNTSVARAGVHSCMDLLLQPAARIPYHNPASCLVIPIHGDVTFISGDSRTVLALHSVQMLTVPDFELYNPDTEAQCRVLVFALTTVVHEETQLFDIAGNNAFHTMFDSPQHMLQIGVFSGRTHFDIPANTFHNWLAMCLNGAFELDDRLIETGDILTCEAYRDSSGEALSENAVIVVLLTN